MDDLDLREYRADDLPKVMDLLAASMGSIPDDVNTAFFRWKHEQSSFGPSPAWVAISGEQIVGLRTFLRWEFERQAGVQRAVSPAVDTATHPDHQGKGIFSRLTRYALEALQEDGVGFVFNTPNDQSRPGYLKMGWQTVGRLAVEARLRGPGALPRVLRARTPAEKWSVPCPAGDPAGEVFSDAAAVERLVERLPAEERLQTHRSASFLRWRYGFEPLAYRAMSDGDATDGIVVFRLRRRGRALEAAICEELVPDGGSRTHLVRRALVESGADYAIRLRSSGAPASRFLPVPGQGPSLVWRSVCSDTMPPLDDWRLTLGDVELF